MCIRDRVQQGLRAPDHSLRGTRTRMEPRGPPLSESVGCSFCAKGVTSHLPRARNFEHQWSC
eukprot:14084487-Alexandrium_andersonii.AAC.1